MITHPLIDCEGRNAMKQKIVFEQLKYAISELKYVICIYVFVTSSNRLKILDKNCRHVADGSVEQPFGILIL